MQLFKADCLQIFSFLIKLDILFPKWVRPALIALFLILASNLSAQDQYFTYEGAERLPDTSVLAKGGAAADIDNDGDMDICAAIRRSWNSIGPPFLLINDGSGYFTCESGTYLPPDSLDANNCAFGDADGDGDLDLFICCEDFFSRFGKDRLYINNGQGIFSDETTQRIPYYGNSSYYAAFADFTEDFLPDLFVQSAENRDSIGTKILQNDSLGYFSNVSFERLPPDSFWNSRGVVLDIDNDLDLDIIETCNNTSYPYFFRGPWLLKNIGGGYFSSDFQDQVPRVWARYIVYGDIDLDDDLDVATSVGDYITLWVNDGTGHFSDVTASHMFGVDSMWVNSDLTLADFDNDGDLDLFLSTEGYSQDHYFVNDGAGYFYLADERLHSPNPTTTSYVVPLDAEGDGDLDIYLACTGFGWQELLINQSTPDTIPPRTLANSILPEQSDSLAYYTVYLSAWDNTAKTPGSIRAEVYFRVNGGNFQTVQMHNLGATLFGAKIPAQPGGSLIEYYYQISDLRDNSSRVPAAAPDSLYSFRVSGQSGISDNGSKDQVGDRIIATPNPFNSTISFSINLRKGGEVTLYITDICGRKVGTVLDHVLMSKGGHKINWDATDNAGQKLSSGVYFARVEGKNASKTIKLILLK